jgi:hypothetical protein
MRIGPGRRLPVTGWILAWLVMALAASPGDAQHFEYVITFDKVVVQGMGGAIDTPELAHAEVPGAERIPPGAEPGIDQTKRSERAAGPSPKAVWRAPDSLLPFAPALGTENPSFVQEGFLVESFWAVRTGTPAAYFKRAHFHPPSLSSGFEGQHLGNPTELHGIFIRSLDGKPFGLKSLRYRVTRNRQIPDRPLSIAGFSNFSVNVLVARSYDPRGPIRAQFVSFPVGLPVGNDTKLPWWTLRMFGFERVDRVYIASSASVDLDDIVLTRSEPPPAPPAPPEPPEEEK